MHHRNSVAGDTHVEFDRVDTEIEGVLECRQRVLRPYACRAAMSNYER